MNSGQRAAGGRQSFARSTMRIFDLSLGEMLWARRTIFMAAIVAAPVFLAVVARVASADGVAVIRINGARVGTAGMFGAMFGVLYLKFIVPALGVFYGTALIADEVEDKTITYLFTRPISRRSIVMGKYLAYLVCSTSVVLPSAMIAFLLMVPFAAMAAAFGPLATDLGILAIGLAAYGALFLLAGVALKRPLVAGLVFAFGWEPIALVMPGYLKHFTIAYYLQALAPQAIPAEDTLSLLQAISRDVPSAASSLISLLVVLVAALVLAMRTVERREYVLEQ
jgi:ABC-type transport system involved in multi-copper enzyme maturation permease subunit